MAFFLQSCALGVSSRSWREQPGATCTHWRVLPLLLFQYSLAQGQDYKAGFALGMQFWKARLSCHPLGEKVPPLHPPTCQRPQTT